MIWKVMRKFEFENVKEWLCDEKKSHRIKLEFLGDSALDLSPRKKKWNYILPTGENILTTEILWMFSEVFFSLQRMAWYLK